MRYVTAWYRAGYEAIGAAEASLIARWLDEPGAAVPGTARGVEGTRPSPGPAPSEAC